MNAFKMKNSAGFSLVELMVTVGIIGLLASMAVPKFSIFKAKAQQAEVKQNLSQIHSLQMSYQFDNSTYGTLAAIGYAAGGTPRYTYTLAAGTTAVLFTVVGTSNAVLCSGGATDVWQINQDKTLGLQSAATDGSLNCN